MSREYYMHVVRFESRDEFGIVGVYSTRKLGLVAALQTVAEHVEYDWSRFPEDMVTTFAALCGIADESSLDDALTFWNTKLDRANSEQGFEDYFRVHVSVELLYDDSEEDNELQMEFPVDTNPAAC